MRQQKLVTLLAAIIVTCGLARTVAGQLGSRPAEDWTKTLEGADRVGGLKVDEVVANLHLKPGEIVADIGAGPGLFEVPMAKAVSTPDISLGFSRPLEIPRNTAKGMPISVVIEGIGTVKGKVLETTVPEGFTGNVCFKSWGTIFDAKGGPCQ